ncbi:hypothetical protein BXY82_2575 [Gelidibacter sediminis]|uniref:Uncharacterized protein n=1 Tax=Gelidibacter sediminis TaxID=1608710 RepID=A0A4R7PZP9_9FLAO|nr:hypothetical protein BXY82_2575 [Gelidibacter sediminis]
MNVLNLPKSNKYNTYFSQKKNFSSEYNVMMNWSGAA